MKAIFGVLAATALVAAPLTATAQHHVLYGARPMAHAAPANHAPMMHNVYGGQMPMRASYRPMNVAHNVYAMNRMQHVNHRFDRRDFDHRDVDHRDVDRRFDNRFVHRRFDDRDFARNAFRDRRLRGGAYDAGYATIQIGGDYGAPYAGDYGDDSSYGDYDSGYTDRGYDSDQDGAYQSQDYDDRGDWSAGAPPADCGRWIWRDYANRYQWVAAACPCPGYDDNR